MPFKKGHSYNKGRKQSPEHIDKLRKTRIGRKWTKEQREKIISSLPNGERHWGWKGDSVSYRSLHTWVASKLGKPMECVKCGVKGLKRYHWANKSKKYNRDLNDWLRLCPKCHASFDKERYLRKV